MTSVDAIFASHTRENTHTRGQLSSTHINMMAM
jgi:hypothetical protein